MKKSSKTKSKKPTGGSVVPASDPLTPEQRSKLMSRVRSKGNLRTELALIEVFRDLGIKGWRRNQAVFGKPDFVFWKSKVAVFVDGCFWHCCPDHATWPKNNSDFWAEKLNRNKERDKLVTRTLKKQGWRVLRIWQHELKLSKRTSLVRRLRKAFVDSENRKG